MLGVRLPPGLPFIFEIMAKSKKKKKKKSAAPAQAAADKSQAVAVAVAESKVSKKRKAVAKPSVKEKDFWYDRDDPPVSSRGSD